jgi:hypothetical protein
MATMSELRPKSDSRETQEHSEGKVARAIEEQTAKIPSDLWLWAAFAAIGGAMMLPSQGKREDGLFIGQWVAPFLLFGVYNKLVKIAGCDRTS